MTQADKKLSEDPPPFFLNAALSNHIRLDITCESVPQNIRPYLPTDDSLQISNISNGSCLTLL